MFQPNRCIDVTNLEGVVRFETSFVIPDEIIHELERIEGIQPGSVRASSGRINFDLQARNSWGVAEGPFKRVIQSIPPQVPGVKLEVSVHYTTQENLTVPSLSMA